MNHYTYELRFENGIKYIGVRSCRCDISKDSSYLGSSKHIPAELYENCEKVILNVFDTRVEAVQDEIRLHNKYSVDVSEAYYNRAKQTSTGFDWTGLTKENSLSVLAAAKKNRSHRGSNRTEKQMQADQKLSQYTGTKNKKKGNSGMSNAKVKPWYYVTPEYEYIEVRDSIRKYVKDGNIHGITTLSGVYFMEEYIHRPLRRGKLKGYTFGYLVSKPEIITQENLDLLVSLAQHVAPIPNIHQTDNRNRNIQNRDKETGYILKNTDSK